MALYTLDEYLGALDKEKRFLQNAGGKKYRITNGRYISDGRLIVKKSTNEEKPSEKLAYTYSFELESELYIADDTPVTISVTNAKDKVTGSVLMCESFQIVIVCSEYLGDSISSAWLSVEPWKLLEAMQERMNRIGQSKIASELVKQGPELATDQPIEKIAKGQSAAISRAESENITIIWGPPGTGKTYTMAKIAIDFLMQNKSVLIVSHSNVSVDGVAKKLYEMLSQGGNDSYFKNGRVLRYGYIRDDELSQNEFISSFRYALKRNEIFEKKLDELNRKKEEIKYKFAGTAATAMITKIHEEIKKIKSTIKKDEKESVNKASIVATTISKVIIDKLFEDKLYDVVMFDEASMAYVPQVICAATYARERFICVGDFMQLPPIAQSDAKTILCKDIFSFLGINKDGKPYYHPWLVMLDEQRRMHPAISKFVIQNIYRNLLRDHESVINGRDGIVNSEPFSGHSIIYVDLAGCYSAAAKNDSNSRFNVLSALVSFALAIEAGKKNKKVSVITPYVAQTRLVRALVEDYRGYTDTNIKCATVHQFQGSESDIVIFDAVESYPGEKTGFLMGKDKENIKRLINVAVTRARGKLIVVGNARFWENTFGEEPHTFLKLQNYVIEKGLHIGLLNKRIKELVDSIDIGSVMTFYSESEKYKNILQRDIIKAKREIVVSLPSGEIDVEISDAFCSAIFEAKKGSAVVKIKCNEKTELPKKIAEFSCETTNAIFPLITIDEGITWYGAPAAAWKFALKSKGGSQTFYKTVVKIAVQIKGEHTCSMLKSLTDLNILAGDRGIIGTITPKDASNSANGKGSLPKWVEQNKKCPICKKSMKLTKGKSGKPILYCKDCKKTDLLSVDAADYYLTYNNVRCPEHGCPLIAIIGKWGLCFRCSVGGEFYSPWEI